MTQGKTNFLNFYFDPNLFTEKQARQILIEDGIDMKRIDKKFNDLYKRFYKKLKKGKNK